MGLLGKLGAIFRSAPVPQDALGHAIGIVTGTIDQRLLAVPGSRDRLLAAIEKAMGYYEGIVAEIPGPVPVSAERHGADPVLAALFPAAEDITQGLGRSLALRNSLNWFAEHGHQEVHAVMGLRLRPQANGGEPRFADHTFRSLAASEVDARQSFCEAAFKALVAAFAAQLKERQGKWRLQRPEGNDSADAELTSEQALEALMEWLETPERQMRLETGDALPAVGAGADGFRLPQLASSDRRKWLVCVTRFSLPEALGAVEREPQAHRYILI